MHAPKGATPAHSPARGLRRTWFPLSTQVQLACHNAKDATAHLTGETPPKIEIKKLTFDELKVLIEKTVEHLKGMSANAFESAEDRKIEIPLQGTLVFESNGFQLLRDWSIPHFYFHVVTAYDILRNNGVELASETI